MDEKLARALSLGILSILALGVMLSNTLPAQAQSTNPPIELTSRIAAPPSSGSVHFYYTQQFYQKQRQRLTSNSSDLVYNNGSVVTSLTAYTIFWDPSNTTSSVYQSLINRYFTDINQSNFYNIVTQYYQSPPQTFISSNSGFGGTYHDTIHAYPGGRGTTTNPLTDQDIQNEVTAAISANGWPNGGLGVEFFVFTAKGIESCYDAVDCTPGTTHPIYCAYHGSFGAAPVLYSNMPYDATWPLGKCYDSAFALVPNNLDADVEISITSHEHFETVTDPNPPTAWYNNTNGEIGDLCGYVYGTQSPTDGSDVTLNGHKYLVQEEWSNADSTATQSGCSINYGVNESIVDLGPASTVAGKNITYTMTITNSGPEPANGLVVSDTVPTNTTFVTLSQNSGIGFTCSTPASGGTGTVRCVAATQANGASAKWTMVVHVNSNVSVGTTTTDTATVSESATNSNPGNSVSSVNTLVSNPTNVTLSSFFARSESMPEINVTRTAEMIPIAGIILSVPFGAAWYARRKRRG